MSKIQRFLKFNRDSYVASSLEFVNVAYMTCILSIITMLMCACVSVRFVGKLNFRFRSCLRTFAPAQCEFKLFFIIFLLAHV